LHLIALVLGGLLMIPFIWAAISSLKPVEEIRVLPPTFWPSHFAWSNYPEVVTTTFFAGWAQNSVVIAILATVGTVITAAMAGYAFAKLRFRGRDGVFRAMSAGLVIPVQVAMLPLFLLMKSLGLINTYWGVIIPSMASIFGIFLIRQYAISIPDDLLDAARIDGASEARIYRSIVLPTITPILATLAIWTFLTTWNDFMWPLIVLSDERRYTLPVALASLVGEHVQDTELMMAGSVLTVLPVVIVFLLLQRYYIQGVMAGSVKG